jgi:hypothetical protein
MSADDDLATEARRGAVLDPQWEVALRSGQAAEGEQGSVEDELAVIHLLRHARGPQPLDDAALERIWDAVGEGARPAGAASGWRAWLRQPWLLGGAAAAAAAVVLVVVWSGPGGRPPGPDHGQVAAVDPEPVVDRGDMAATIEAQFAMLEPGARAEVARSVDAGRSSLRGELLASAIAADGRTMGGAP